MQKKSRIHIYNSFRFMTRIEMLLVFCLLALWRQVYVPMLLMLIYAYYVERNYSARLTDWADGRPSEIILEGVQCHYYAIAYETLQTKITEYDDVAFYVYGNAIVFNDNAGLYAKLRCLLLDDETVISRKNSATDMLVRRNSALKQILANEDDPILRIKMGIEIIELLLKAIALADGVQFDKRKRFYTTSLIGGKAQRLRHKMDIRIDGLSDISRIGQLEACRVFMQTVDACIDTMRKQ